MIRCKKQQRMEKRLLLLLSNTIVIGGVTNNYWNGVFYKLMLYSKTLPLLQINYLKNLMEKDEIIDLNNKIFIQE